MNPKPQKNCRIPHYLPTPQEIREQCDEILAGLTEEERDKRQGRRNVPYEIPECGLNLESDS